MSKDIEALIERLEKATEALESASRWIDAEFLESEIELNGALSNVHAAVSNEAYESRRLLRSLNQEESRSEESNNG